MYVQLIVKGVGSWGVQCGFGACKAFKQVSEIAARISTVGRKVVPLKSQGKVNILFLWRNRLLNLFLDDPVLISHHRQRE